MKLKTIAIPTEAHAELKLYAAELRIGMRSAAERAIRSFVPKRIQKNGKRA